MPLHRRAFLKLAAKTAAGVIVAPSILPSTVFGAAAPSRRIALGIIGVGSQGGAHLKLLVNDTRVRIVQICDVDTERRERARKFVDKTYGAAAPSGSYRGCAATGDFRELLARPDIDAVLVALPDHWHALVVIHAAQAGKDIYAEKPFSLTIPEGRAMVEAVRESGVVCQVGSQQRSSAEFQRCVELARNGFLGELKRVKVGLPAGIAALEDGPIQNVEPPPGFDYEFWLGPAPYAPYCPQRCHYQFRWIFDYSGGQLTDWIGHHFDIGAWGAGVGRTGPTRITDAWAQFPCSPLYNTAEEYFFKAHYEGGPVFDIGSQIRGGVEFIGTEGSCWADRGMTDFSSPTLRTAVIPSDGFRIRDPHASHWQNFFDCVASRQTPRCPVEEAHRDATVAHLANLAFRTGRKELQWDPVHEQIVDAPDATRLMTRDYRGPWQLPC
jgi:predicted dehydrogenase